MIFPQEQGLALRVYYYPSIADTQKQQRILDADQRDSDEGDVDGILDFTRHFQWSVIVFVVPDITVLDDPNSFVQRAMRLVDAPVPQKGNQQPPRILVVASTDQVITSIMALADAIAPARCALRGKFCRKTRLLRFCDDSSSAQDAAAADTITAEEEEDAMQAAASRQVATAVREWGDRAGFPLGEADILLRGLGNLTNLVSSAVDANTALLGTIPVEDRTKRELRRFFSGNNNDDVVEQADDDPTFRNNVICSDPTMTDDGAIFSPPPFGNLPVAGMGVYPQAPFGMDDQTYPANYYNDGGMNYHQDPAPPHYHQQQQQHQQLLTPPQYESYHPTPNGGRYHHAEHHQTPHELQQQRHHQFSTNMQRPHTQQQYRHKTNAATTPWGQQPQPQPPHHLSPNSSSFQWQRQTQTQMYPGQHEQFHQQQQQPPPPNYPPPPQSQMRQRLPQQVNGSGSHGSRSTVRQFM